ncbi:MAG: hypothetical protein HOO99_16465 [Hyphomicrobiaceae bacterium]|nr:hypothetical protein [Hyphomicrobiaceae bacterium]
MAVMPKEAKRHETLRPRLLADIKAIADAPRFNVHGELHLQHHEACVWVLLANKGDARAALLAMRPTLQRYQSLWPDVKVTLPFNAIEGDMRIYIAHLEGEEINDAQQLAQIDTFMQSVPLSQHVRSFWEIE